MFVVHSDDLGAVSFSRALRDGALAPLTTTTAAPIDVPITPALRSSALMPTVPTGAVVTGLAGLWVDGLTPYPATLDVLRRTGTHRAPRRLQAHSRISIHAGDAEPGTVRELSEVAVASTARCAVDALRWAPLGPAITAVWAALRSGLLTVSEVDAAFKMITDAGYKAKVEPFDAFWGQRYATVLDPDGNPVDLYAALE